MDDFNKKYFLAANSCEGFANCFSDSFSSDWRVYIIKGGPGTGKSSFMKFLAAKALEMEIDCELCFCSSDPNSLDAVIFPEKKITVLDGTAPHILDPIYPAVCERILNFGDFWRVEDIEKHREKIIELTNENKKYHNTVARYLCAMGEPLRDNINLAKAATDAEKAEKSADRLCERYIPKRKGKYFKNYNRFLCGITPEGVVSFAKTALNITEKQIVIEDKFGAVSHIIFKKVKKFAQICGYNTITVKNCFLPSKLTDAIIIPELKLSFAREYEYQHFNIPIRRIHASRFMDMKKLSDYRERANFNNKVAKELLKGAVVTLKKAKATHDMLEHYYISAMDFDRLTAFANEFAKSVLK